MSISVTCPSGHLLLVADSMAGRAGRCPFCREIVQVPPLTQPIDRERSALPGQSPNPAAAHSPANSPPNPIAMPRVAASSGTAPAKMPPPIAPPPLPPAAPPPITPLSPAPASGFESASDPAGADTILMPLSLAELSTAPATELVKPQADAEPDSPFPAEPDLMSQTLPLPTAELMPKRPAGIADIMHEINFDTIAQKAKIIGSWKVLGDVEPPYVPESAAHRATAPAITAPVSVATSGAAKAFAAAEAAIASPPEGLPRTDPFAALDEPARSRRPGSAAQSGHAQSPGESNGSAVELDPAPKDSWLRAPTAVGSAWPRHATVYRIAGAVAVVSLLSMWPALRYWDLGAAPGWARGALLVAILQLAYAAWLISIPDWASLWAAMFVLAIVATLYGIAAAMTLAAHGDLPLGMKEPMRTSAAVWCFTVMLLWVIIAYICGHAAQRTRHPDGSIRE